MHLSKISNCVLIFDDFTSGTDTHENKEEKKKQTHSS